VHQALQGDIQAKLASSGGMEPAPSTPEALKATIAADIALHAELVKATGIQPQ
jgi:tripartite-type tricarboxylate transporter receptor subunit TctC